MSRTITYKEALNEAMRIEMSQNPDVFVMGLAVGKRGGSYGVTKGLYEEFGPERVMDTPISEASFTGMAVGAAIQGKRPVVEITFVDFSFLSMEMLMNQAAKYTFLTGRNVPLVLRTQGGAGMSVGPQHSQSLEAFFYHMPGLLLAMPSTPSDAGGLLRTAITLDQPVVFIEHKLLYKTSGEVPETIAPIPFGKAAVRREGGDCTIISYSLSSLKCLEAAENLSAEGISCEVIDLRSLVPMDRETVLKSVSKTGRVVIVCEAPERGSVGPDISGWLSREMFGKLKAPVGVLAGKMTPIPYNEKLEKVCVPGGEDVEKMVRGMVV